MIPSPCWKCNLCKFQSSLLKGISNSSSSSNTQHSVGLRSLHMSYAELCVVWSTDFKPDHGLKDLERVIINTWLVPRGIMNFVSRESPLFPKTKSRETWTFEGNKIHCSPRDKLFSDLLYSKTSGSNRWKANDHFIDKWRATAVNNFAGNSALFPVWRHSFRNVSRSWHLAGNSFIVRCHVTMN